MELVIGTKAWSTWSLRPWLALRRAGVEFTDEGLGATSTTVVEDGTELTRSKNRRVELTGVIKVKECPGQK